MAGPVPRTDKWTARENEHKDQVLLIVHGLVEVSNTNKKPRLTRQSPAAGPAKTLVLDLTIEDSGDPANDVVVWKAAEYDQDVRANEFSDVEIRWNGKSIAKCKVLDDDEHVQHLLALTQAANKAHPATSAGTPGRAPAQKRRAKKSPGKKSSAKKSAAKKRPAKKSVGKKGPAKKSRVKKRVSTSAKRRSASPKRRSSAAAKRRPASRKRR